MLDDLMHILWCFFVKVLNFLIDYVLDSIFYVLAWALNLLPTVPILAEPLDWGVFGDAVGYFIPISSMIAHFSSMLLMMILWFTVQHILRIAKQIQ